MTRVHEADFPAEQPQAQAAPRLPLAHGDQERPQGAGPASRQGPPEAVGLGPSQVQTLALERLRLRREFLFVAQGPAERRKNVVVQARQRVPFRGAAGTGFTSTKKIGNAVIRNRSRRRLREGVRALLPRLGLAGVDYVFIARIQTADCPWPQLLDDVETALVSLRRRILAGEDAQPPRISRPGKSSQGDPRAGAQGAKGARPATTGN